MYASIRQLGLAVALLGVGGFVLPQAHAQSETAFIEAPARSSLENSVWTGFENLGGNRAMAFRFGANGQVSKIDDDGELFGRYRVWNGRLELSFGNGSLVYSGVLNGRTMSGVARTAEGTWRFGVGYRQPSFSGQQSFDSIPPSPPLPPINPNGFDRPPYVPSAPSFSGQPFSRVQPGRGVESLPPAVSRPLAPSQFEPQPPSPPLPPISPSGLDIPQYDPLDPYEPDERRLIPQLPFGPFGPGIPRPQPPSPSLPRFGS
jgi:hypothetical protein